MTMQNTFAVLNHRIESEHTKCQNRPVENEMKDLMGVYKEVRMSKVLLNLNSERIHLSTFKWECVELFLNLSKFLYSTLGEFILALFRTY